MGTSTKSRRKFLNQGLLTSLSVLGSQIVFGQQLSSTIKTLEGKAFDELPMGKHKELILLNDRPLNIETPAHLLDDKITPYDKMFVRNNGNMPAVIDAKEWTLTIEGESALTSKTFTINDLKTQFKPYTYQLTLECGGNGRSGFSPQAAGNQWKEGGVSCAEWTGVRLKDLLKSVGIKADAVYIGYYGKDIHLSGDLIKSTISRGVPIQKALEEESIVAYAMNGQDIPMVHGYPLRLVIGGWPASVSGKWLHKIFIRNKVHDGEKMDGTHYRVPKYPVEPGTKVSDTDFRIIESLPVKSIISYPKSGAMITSNETITLRGHAWAGDLEVAQMSISIDFGASWQPCNLEKPINRLAWQHWETQIKFPKKGYYEVWAKATDTQNISQPMVTPAWNPGGYLNNACHRIAIKVE